VSGRGVVELFGEAAQMPAPERDAFLDRECAGDARLRAEVASLLSHLDSAGGFLARGLFDGPIVEPKMLRDASLANGTRVSRYKVDRMLGEGGMGIVYLAQQETPRRDVALKVIRPSAATPAMLRRFVREAEVLGRLQHPGIAQIFEAGTADVGGGAEQPFLAMELVIGEPITDYARRAGLGLRERLDLIARLCDAVEHAHQRGMIHRDLKPANILVDGLGQPKILDFGVARAIDAGLPGATMATEVGTLIGTLAYMSPEQVGGDPASVDTRSDVYGLGVILYELVCGRRPLELGESGLFEAARRIRDEEPARPGTLKRELRGDVETIVLKAIAKDRERRYASAGALREDLRRYLAGEPIMARQDSTLYILRKTVRRHRGLVAGIALTLVGLAAFGVYASIQSEKERRARVHAEMEQQRADRTADLLADELHVSSIAQARWMMQEGLFAAAEQTLWREHLSQPTSMLSLWGLRDLYSRFPCIATLPTHDTDARCLSVSSDRSIVVAGDAGGTASIWSWPGRERLSTVKAGPRAIWGVAVHPSLPLLATLGNDGQFKLWDIARPSAPSLNAWSPTGMSPSAALVYSQDGSMLAAAGVNQTVLVLDGRTLEVKRTFKPSEPPPGRFLAAAFDDAGKRLAFAGDEGKVFLTDLDGPETVPVFADTRWDVAAVAFTHDGTKLFAGNTQGQLWVWDSATGAMVRRLVTPHGTIRSIELTADDRTIYTSNYWQVNTIDLETGAVAPPSRPRGGFRTQLVGDTLLSTSSAGDVRAWDVRPDRAATSIAAHTRYLGKASVSDAGSRLYTAGADGSCAVWDTATWNEVARVNRTREFYPWVGAISPDGRLMAVVGRAGGTKLLEVAGGHIIAEFAEPTAAGADCLFTADGRRFVVASSDGQLIVFRTDERRLEHTLQKSGSEVFRLGLVAGDRFAVGQRGTKLRFWDAAAGTLADELVVNGTVWCLDFTPDRGRVAVGYFAGDVEVWDIPTKSLVRTLEAHSQLLRHLRYSPDGTLLATTAGDGPPKLWDARTGAFLTRVGTPGTNAQPSNLLFIPGTDTLVTTFDDGHFEARSLSYFDRSIAGNLEFQLQRLAPELGPRLDEAAVRAWSGTLRPPTGP
jgi:eukaryotic-like serine/threonine-protein kinase